METKFQTSFIPKKPLVSSSPLAPVKRRSTNVFMLLGVLLFLVSLGGAGFVLLWEQVLITAQKNYESDLNKRKNQFNPQLIEDLRRANVKIDLSRDLLKNHLAVSQAFDIISKLTIQSVRFRSFEVNAPTGISREGVKLVLRGEAANFSSIAFQSDVLGKSAEYGTNKIIKNPILSDLVLDAAGNVSFTLTTQLTPTDISYEKFLAGKYGEGTEVE
jgi:uncharacterized membrane protein YjjP (DUF1212 family)